MKRKLEPRIQTSFRMTRTAYELMYKMAREMGLRRASVVELAIRELFRRHAKEAK